MFRKIVSFVVLFVFTTFCVIPPSFGQTISTLNLPLPGTMVQASQAFVPILLKGITLHMDDPLKFDFIVDSGQSNSSADEIKKESQRLVKYFLASLTIPKNDLWVNLSPYEADRTIPDELAKTEMGRDLLAQDYLLKQLTASLIYPEKDLGKKFWDEVYKHAQEKMGVNEIPLNTFNKVWIIPESATVYENGQTVYIVQSRLKVMLDEDYKLQTAESIPPPQWGRLGGGKKKQTPSLILPTGGRKNTVTELIREIILPEIEKEVNEGQNFAPLRQIYYSLILAKWYKETVKNSLLSKVYINQSKVSGIELNDATIKDQIYERYMQAYKKGVFDFIKEDYDQISQEVIPKKYFSGGFKDADIAMGRTADRSSVKSSIVGSNYTLAMRIAPQKEDANQAMLGVGSAIPIVAGVGMDYQSTLGDVMDRVSQLASGHPVIISLIVGTGLTAAYQIWSRFTVSGNLWRLKSDDFDTRRSAAKALKKLGASASQKQKVFDGYLKILSSDSSEARRLAIEALGELGDQRAIEPLLKKLGENSYREIAEALKKLGATPEQMVEGYLKALSSNSSYDRRSAAAALGKLGDRRAVEPLIARLEDENSSVRRSAAEALGELGDKRAVEPLLKKLEKDYYYALKATANALGKLGDRRAVEPLLKKFGEDGYSEIAAALKKLGASQEQMVDGYLEALSSNSFDASRSAAEALGKLGDKRAVGPLIARLGDDDFNVRKSAAEALGKLGDQRAVEPLIARLGDKDFSVRHLAVMALNKLGASPEQMVDGYLKVLSSHFSEARGSAVYALGELGDKMAVEPLIARLGDNDSDVRQSAARALGKLGDKRAVEPLMERLGDGHPYVRQSAAKALGELGDRRAVEPLRKLLSKTSRTIQISEYGYYNEILSSSTEDNPEYQVIEAAIKKLTGEDSAMLAPLNRELVEQAIRTGKISIDQIQDAKLKRFLAFLKDKGLTNIVVIGGAVRSILFGEPVRDIDISIKTALTPAERESFTDLKEQGTERVYQKALAEITHLAEAMALPVDDFLPPSRGPRAIFEGLDIDYFGPIKVPSRGQSFIPKRSLYDETSREGYFTNTGAELSKLAIDADGNLYGPRESLQKLLDGEASVLGNGENFGINDILRLLRLKYQYGLKISAENNELIKTALAKIKGGASLPATVLDMARILTEIILSTAQDQKLAERELGELGILKLIQKSKTASGVEGGQKSRDEAQLADFVPIVAGAGMGEGIHWEVINQILEQASNHPVISVLAVGASFITAYQIWSRLTVSGNLWRLKSQGAFVRESAAKALGNLGDRRAVEPLLKMPRDKDRYVRLAVIRALGKLGDRRALEPLHTLLSEMKEGGGDEGDNLNLLDTAAIEAAIKKLEAGGDKASLSDVGGIDLNNIKVKHQGSGINIEFDPKIIQPILEQGVDGFAPVFLNLTLIKDLLPVLGL